MTLNSANIPDLYTEFRQNEASTMHAIKSKVTLVAANYLEAQKEDETPFHAHPDILHITYILSGQGNCQIGDHRYPLKKGMIHFVFPNEPHLFSPDTVDPYHKYIVKLKCVDYNFNIFPRFIETNDREKEFLNHFQTLNYYFTHKHRLTDELKERAHLYLLLADIFSYMDEMNLESVITTPSITAKNFSTVLNELSTPPFVFPGIDKLAKQCHISKRKFIDMFFKATQMNVHHFFLTARMNYAKRMIESKTFHINEIAEKCSYSNSQNFIRTFKKFFGESPKQWAKDQ